MNLANLTLGTQNRCRFILILEKPTDKDSFLAEIIPRTQKLEHLLGNHCYLLQLELFWNAVCVCIFLALALIRYAIRVSIFLKVKSGHTSDFKPCQNEKWLIDRNVYFSIRMLSTTLPTSEATCCEPSLALKSV